MVKMVLMVLMTLTAGDECLGRESLGLQGSRALGGSVQSEGMCSQSLSGKDSPDSPAGTEERGVIVTLGPGETLCGIL